MLSFSIADFLNAFDFAFKNLFYIRFTITLQGSISLKFQCMILSSTFILHLQFPRTAAFFYCFCHLTPLLHVFLQEQPRTWNGHLYNLMQDHLSQ